MGNDIPTTDPSPTPSALAAARDYIARGWSPIPVPFRKKNPGFKDWEQLQVTTENILEYFPGRPSNIGVLLGAPSDWLVDVDLDYQRCVELADQFLPSTAAEFGRAGKPRSHRLYRVKGPIATIQLKTKSTGMLVELRSTGAQTVFPPSVHESGELIEWVDAEAEPTLVDSDVLVASVKQLADAVKVELGLKAAPKTKRTSRKKHAFQEAETGPICDGSRNVTLTSQGGKLRRLGMTEAEIEAALQHINEKSCQPPLDPAEVTRIAASVASYAASDEEDNTPDEDGNVPLGSRDPESGRLVLSPKRTLPTAIAYLREFHRHPDATTLVAYLGGFLQWSEGCYRTVEDAALHRILQSWLHQALRYSYIKKTDSLELVDFESNPSAIKTALDSIRPRVFLPATHAAPFWRTSRPELPPPTELLVCRSVLIHLPTGTRLSATPALFTLNALDFDHEADAAAPTAWLAFLDQLFGADTEAIELLQEWFGYCLIADTSQQKMLLIVGPKRSGKGTIARILQRLVGIHNVCSPTTSGLAGPFGLQPLLHKTLSIVSDARFHGDNISTVVERLLCISGEDTITVDRKHLESVTLKLSTRFMFLSNELPRFTDASGALAGRFEILRLTQSFYGRENPMLTTRLSQELPGILNWAIAGWQRLRGRGYFVQPGSASEAVQDLEDLGSPVKAFARECCRVEPGQRVELADLFERWRGWCDSIGREHAGTSQSFSRDLQAAFPGIKSRRGTCNVRFFDGIALQ